MGRVVVIGDTAAQGYVDPLLVSAVANPKVIAPILFGGPYDSTKIQNRVFDYLDHELPDLSGTQYGELR